MTLKEQILAAEDIPSELVTIPEWGGVTVKVRGLNAGEFLELYGDVGVAAGGDKDKAIALIADRDQGTVNGKTVAYCVLDPSNGEPLFSTPEEVLAKSLPVIARLAGKAMDLTSNPVAVKENLDETPASEPASKSQ